jgi:L-cysteine desulfidase
LSKERNKKLLDVLRTAVTPASGCTEPAAVAYSTALARSRVSGELVAAEIRLDQSLYKNALRVGIPGTTARGLEIAAALGIVAGKPERGFGVIDQCTEKDVEKAQEIVRQKKVNITVNENCSELFIETVLTTDKEKVRVITKDQHLNVVSIEKGDHFSPWDLNTQLPDSLTHDVQAYDLEDFISFAETVPIEELTFLEDGIAMNMAIAREGFSIRNGASQNYLKLVSETVVSDDMVSLAERLCAAACEARMSGSRLPAMTCAGSGNQGITVFLTMAAVAEKTDVPREKLLRALALSTIITVYCKSFTGILSPMCGCAISAGVGTSAGVVYLLGGGGKQIMGAVSNVVGSISGMICDGAKEGCAYKVALASGWAIKMALLSIRGSVISETNGILADNFRQLFDNLGALCKEGMASTNKVILRLLTKGGT